MLHLRPNCEGCDCDLPADTAFALICSYECTFCAACAQRLAHRCPNCAGELVRRPLRAADRLRTDPASKQRVRRPHSSLESRE